MLPNIQELIFQKLSSELRDIRQSISKLSVQGVNKSQVTGGVQSLTVAKLPATNTTGGDMYWASNGRKTAEGAGSGTGVLVVWDPSTTHWLRLSDYSQVLS